MCLFDVQVLHRSWIRFAGKCISMFQMEMGDYEIIVQKEFKEKGFHKVAPLIWTRFYFVIIIVLELQYANLIRCAFRFYIYLNSLHSVTIMHLLSSMHYVILPGTNYAKHRKSISSSPILHSNVILAIINDVVKSNSIIRKRKLRLNHKPIEFQYLFQRIFFFIVNNAVWNSHSANIFASNFCTRILNVKDLLNTFVS